MTVRIGVISARRSAGVSPAQTCVMEMEDVIADVTGGTILPVLDPAWRDEGATYDVVIVGAISYWEASRLIQAARPLLSRSGRRFAYVFDAFHHYLSGWLGRFPRPVRELAALARHELRSLRLLDGIFMPIHALTAEQSGFLGVPVHYTPIGVATRHVVTAGHMRPIDVNAYGRQPRALTDLLSDTMNAGGDPRWFSHTDHMQLSLITDPVRHRRLFWRTLSRSKIALAYASDVYDPAGRFDASFVGQRWYESAAAGCVIVGRAPVAAETRELFGWADALIDLPQDFQAAADMIDRLLADPMALRQVGHRNRIETLRRHDWAHRVAQIADVVGLDDLPRLRLALQRLATEAEGETNDWPGPAVTGEHPE